MLPINGAVSNQGFGPMVGKQVVARAMPNPMDRSTIISVYHKDVESKKMTVFPGVFRIPKAPSEDSYSITIIGTSSWWKQVEEERFIEIPVNSYNMARSIVDDYVNALYASKGPSQRPGIFYIPGEHNQKALEKWNDGEGNTFQDYLNNARAAQKKYYQELVRTADILWARTNQNPLSISDDARLAAEVLGLKDRKEWMGDFKRMEMSNCEACGFMVNPVYPLCPNCKHIVNKERAAELGLTAAK